jgi:hypothetical protein
MVDMEEMVATVEMVAMVEVVVMVAVLAEQLLALMLMLMLMQELVAFPQDCKYSLFTNNYMKLFYIILIGYC